MLEGVFETVFNMSLSASIAAVLIVLFRWIVRNSLPRILFYSLWSIVLLRLICPFFLPSIFSIYNIVSIPNTLITQNLQYQDGELQKQYKFRQNISSIVQNPSNYNQNTDNINENDAKGYSQNQYNQDSGSDLPNNNYDGMTGKTTVENLESNIVKENSVYPSFKNDSNTSSKTVRIFLTVASWIWITGVICLLLFEMILYYSTSKKLEEAVLYNTRNHITDFCIEKLKLKRKVKVFISDRINTPFAHGVFKPRIMLPSKLIVGSSEQDLKYIIMHELVHIKRFDYIIKLISILVLCIYWFNPVIWLCFVLSQKDMEMSCDGKVLAVFENDIRKEYASILVSLAQKQNSILGRGFPAFGESSIKSRIKGIMNYRKPGILIGLAAVAALVVFIMLFLTDSYPIKEQNDEKQAYSQESIDLLEYEAIKKAVLDYYTEYEPDTLEKLNISMDSLSNLDIILEIERYGDNYLVLAEKYYSVGQNWSFPNLLMINNAFIVESVSFGLTSDLPYFATYSTIDEDKQIACGRIQNSQKEPEASDISEIQIIFEDGTIVRDLISKSGGYIVIANTTAEIKDIELYNDNEKIQNIIKENPPYKKCSFTATEHKDEYPDNCALETVIINDCVAKSGPGDHFESIDTYKYGDIVFVKAKYSGWAKCERITHNIGENDHVWIKTSNLIDDSIFNDNYGIITADEVTVGLIAAKKGNLIRVLIKNEDESCVSLCHIDAMGGKTGWIDNSTYSLPEPGIYFNQAFLKKGTYAYSEPSITYEKYEVEYVSIVHIIEEKGKWAYFETFGPRYGWVLKENLYIPPNLMEAEEREGYRVLEEYFDALEKSDYNRMTLLSTEYHKNNYINNNGLKKIEGARLRSILVCAKEQETESTMAFDVYIEKDDYEGNIVYRNFFDCRVILIKEKDGIWRVDRFEYRYEDSISID